MSKIYIFLVLILFASPIFSQVSGISSTTLPLLVINTNGQAIQESGKITSTLKLIYNGVGKVNTPTDAGNIFSGNIGIEYRGKASATEQNPFDFETRDASGANLDVSLLGMPLENDWVLLACYNDKTFMRNSLAFHLFYKMAHYAPRTKLVEVVVNNTYQGIYILTEKIKRDKGRVDVSKLTATDTSGDNLTGGYIFKIDSYDATDSWLSNYSPIDHQDKAVHYVFDDPSATDLVQAQKDYLKTAVNSFEKVLYSPGFADKTTGYAAWMKMNSFLDFFIVNEVSRNIDGFNKNCYFFKNKDSKDSKFHAGPVWNFDESFKNIKDCEPFNADDGSGWSYKINDCPNIKNYSNGWMVRLVQDPAFVNALNSRYTLMRNSYLSNQYLTSFIDSVQSQAKEAQARHYAKWNILGQTETYDGQVLKMKNWLQTRLTWLDGHLPGIATSSEEFEEGFSYRIFPNPSNDVVYLESSSEIESYKIYRVDGACVSTENGISAFSTSINVSNYPHGIYLIQLRTKENKTINSKLVVQ